MKAVIYDRYGPPEVLKLAEVPQPERRDGEVMIRVKATEVTKADCELRSFNFPVKWFSWPLRLAFGIRRPRRPILGSYFAGEVVATTGPSSRFQVGEAVFGCAQMRMGAYGEFVCLPERYTLVTKPARLSFVEAASLPLGGLNALHFLNKAQLRSGEGILIIGAGGSIGLLAVQIAKARGARVTAVDKASKEAVVRQAGADDFIDYTLENLSERPERFDVVFSMVAGGSYRLGTGLLTPEGRYLIGNPRLSDMLRSIWTGWFSSQQAYFAFAGETRAEIEELSAMIEDGEIRAIVDREFPMEDAAQAHAWVELEKRNGAVVLDLTER